MLDQPEQLADILQKWTEVFMRRSMREFYHFIKESSLSASQLSTLMHLYHHESCGVTDVGSRLGVTNAAASQLIDKLVQQDLLTRAEDPVDRRVKHIALTAGGRQLIEQAIEARRRWMEELTTTLTPEEQKEISAALKMLTHAAMELDRQSEMAAGQHPASEKES